MASRRQFLLGGAAVAGVATAAKYLPKSVRAQSRPDDAALPFRVTFSGLCALAQRPSSRDTSVVLLDAGRLPHPLHVHVPVLVIPADCVATATWEADAVTVGPGGRQYAQWSLAGAEISLAGSFDGGVAMDPLVPDLRAFAPVTPGAPAVEHFIDLKHLTDPLEGSMASCRLNLPIAAIRGVLAVREPWVFRTDETEYSPYARFSSGCECDIEVPDPVVLKVKRGADSMEIQVQPGIDGSGPTAFVSNLPGHLMFGTGHGSDPTGHFGGYYELLARKGATPLPVPSMGPRDVFPVACFVVVLSK